MIFFKEEVPAIRKSEGGELVLHKDSFSHGQIMSKLWLCDELMKLVRGQQIKSDSIHLYGGWYGLLSLMLKTHKELRHSVITSFDMDQKACDIALRLNGSFVFEDQSFQAQCQDVNDLPAESTGADIIINTSCEHMRETLWFERIESKKICILQSNDMIHEQHVNNVHSLTEFAAMYPMTETLFAEEKYFDYGETAFSRYMLIGYK